MTRKAVLGIMLTQLIINMLTMVLWQTVSVNGHAPGISLSAFTTRRPTIDGAINPDEWQDAATISTTIYEYELTFFAMNDLTNLYMAVRVSDHYKDPTKDYLTILFDNDHDNILEVGDDMLRVLTAESIGFCDYFWYNVTPGSYPSDGPDVDFGGTADGSGATRVTGDFREYEIQHPFNSTDDLHDISLKAGGTVGFCLDIEDYLEGVGGRFIGWPAYVLDWNFTGPLGDITIAAPRTWIVDDDGPADFHTIQEAIDAANPGDTIYVYNGTYHENVVINKPVTLVGENRETTIIDGGGTGNVLMINYTAPNVTIENFTIRNVAWASYSAVVVVGHLYYWDQDIKQNVTIQNNNIVSGYFSGVWLGEYCYGVTVANNNISYNYWGIYALNSGFNIIIGNHITYNDMCGIGLQQGMCYYNEIVNNYISNNKGDYGGIFINWVGGGNILRNNDIIENSIGVEFNHATDPYANTIYHNNFINNTIQVKNRESNNTWDNSYPSGGNYWNNYTGVDVKSDPNQNQSGSDGIGDSPHTIDANNQDRFPLMAPISVFDAGTWNEVNYYVNVVSNSTLSNFYFNPDEGAFIRFNITGESGTTGFSRVAIPKQLLWVENGWVILVDDEPIIPTVAEDGNYTYLYFTYNHSTKTVIIQGTHVIPEFPPTTILPLLIVLTMLGLVFAKRRLKNLKFQKS